MTDFSIDFLSQQIISKATKVYFKEVASSYFNDNYRAALVTLYSVVITDVINKLEELDEIYSDKSAKSILDEIKSLQISNPTSAEWEKDIIEKVKTRTFLIDNVDYAHFQALRNDRHLCAHPFIDKDEKLYTPNKETVASHIRNMLDSFFLKPALLSKKILSPILSDISEKKEILIDNESLERYVVSKYLNNINPLTEVNIFKDLWKFVFRLTDDLSVENRQLNFRLLCILYKRNATECSSQIISYKSYFSNITAKPLILSLLVIFLSEREFLYNNFTEAVKLLLVNHIEKDPSNKTVAWFLSNSYIEHIELIKKLFKSEFNSTFPYDGNVASYQRLLKIGKTKGYKKEVCDFISWKYSNAKDFNDADRVYEYYLKHYIEDFTVEQLKVMLDQANNNGQVTGRKKAEDDHKDLLNFLNKNFSGTIALTEYPNIFNIT